MGEVVNLNKYRRERKRQLRQSKTTVISAKITPETRDQLKEEVGQLEDRRERSSIGVLSLPQPQARKHGPKEGGPETDQ